jgi:hypothetical protein
MEQNSAREEVERIRKRLETDYLDIKHGKDHDLKLWLDLVVQREAFRQYEARLKSPHLSP